MNKATVKKFAVRGLLVLVALFLLIQLIPYGCNHTNPPVTKEPAWSSPAVRQLAVNACYDCHSNATFWPWYSFVAPTRWLVQSDVDEARHHLNFSEWDQHQHGAPEAPKMIASGDMPLWYYRAMHSDARLTAAEKDQLSAEIKRLAAEQAAHEKNEPGQPSAAHDHDHDHDHDD